MAFLTHYAASTSSSFNFVRLLASHNSSRVCPSTRFSELLSYISFQVRFLNLQSSELLTEVHFVLLKPLKLKKNNEIFY
jgi:hypothetical protein